MKKLKKWLGVLVCMALFLSVWMPHVSVEAEESEVITAETQKADEPKVQAKVWKMEGWKNF